MWRLLPLQVGLAGALTGAGPKYPKVAKAQTVDANRYGFQSGGAFGAAPPAPQPYAPDAGMWSADQNGNWASASTPTAAKAFPGAGFESSFQNQGYYGAPMYPGTAPAAQYPGYPAGGYGNGSPGGAYAYPPEYSGYFMQAPQGPTASSFQGQQQQQFPMSPPAPQGPWPATPVQQLQPAFPPASMVPQASPVNPYPQAQAPQAPPAPAKPEPLKPIQGPLPSDPAGDEPKATWEPIPVTGPINQIDRDIQNIISSWTGVKTPEAPLAKDPEKTYALGFMG